MILRCSSLRSAPPGSLGLQGASLPLEANTTGSNRHGGSASDSDGSSSTDPWSTSSMSPEPVGQQTVRIKSLAALERCQNARTASAARAVRCGAVRKLTHREPHGNEMVRHGYARELILEGIAFGGACPHANPSNSARGGVRGSSTIQSKQTESEYSAVSDAARVSSILHPDGGVHHWQCIAARRSLDALAVPIELDVSTRHTILPAMRCINQFSKCGVEMAWV